MKIPSPEEEAAEAEARDRRWFWDHILTPRLHDAKELYTASVNSVWIANGAGTASSLAFIGATWRQGDFYELAVLPFGLFMAGLLVMGIGSAVTLLMEHAAIKRLYNAGTIWGMKVGEAKSPWRNAGLSFAEPRTIAAALSALFFLAGLISGFAVLCPPFSS